MKGKNRSNPLLPPLPPPYPPPPSLSSLLPSSSPLPTSPEQQNLPPDPFNLLNTWLSPFNIIGANPFGGNGQLIQKLGMLDLANILSQPYTLIQATVPLFPTFRPDDSRSTRRNSAFDNDISAENNIERANIFNVNNQNKDSADALNDSANAPKTDESNPPMLSAETVCPTCSGSFEDPKLAIFCNECQKWIHKKCCSKHFAKEEGLKKGRGNKDPDNEGGSEKEKGKKSTTNKKEKKDNNKGLDEDDNEKENEEMEEVEKEPYPIVTRSSLKRKHEQDQKKDTQINRRVHFNNYNRTRRSQDNNSRRSLSLSRSRTNRGRMTRKSGYRAENEDDDKGDSGSSSEDETQIMRPGSPQRPMLSPILSSSSSPSPELGPKEAPLQLEHLPILTQQAGPGQTLAQQTPVEPMPPLKQANRTTSTSPNTSAPNKSGPASSSTINIEPPETDADSSTDTAITFCSIDMSILACDMCTICGTCGTLYQDIISCVDCGQSFHVECIHYTGPLFYGYTWRCPECSICEKCGKHCTTADSVACATCSCLYHASCIGTTLVPWFWECDACKMMKVLKQQQNPAQAVAASVGLPVGTPPVGQLDDECYSGDEEMTIEEEAFEERTENVPCPSDTRTCIICGGKEEADDRLLFVECDTWAHTQCTLLSDGVTVSDTNKIYGLKETIEANKMTKCSLCGKTGGVTVSCYTKKCPKRYHPKCAIASGGTVFKNKRIPKKLYSFFCEPHMRKISRLMYVEPVPIPTISRSRGIPKIVVLHKKSLRKFPARLGNFSVISIGLNPRRYLKKSFDSDIRAYPMYRLGWRSMLLFWDYKNPKEKCLYRCEIVQNIKVPVKEATCKNLVAKVTVIRNGLESDTFVAPSTSEIWCKIIELINSARGPEKLHFKGGDYYFGFTNSLVLETINEDEASFREVDPLESYYAFIDSCQHKETAPYREQCAREGGRDLWNKARNCKLTALRNKYNSRKKGNDSEGTHQNAPLSSGAAVSSLGQSPNGVTGIAFHDNFGLPLPIRYRQMQQSEGNFVIKKSPIQGMGIFSLKAFPPNSMLFEYKGEVIRLSVADIREEIYQRDGIGYYMFSFPTGNIVDATLSGSLSRFINHSHSPNCKAKTIEIFGQHHIILITKAHIEQGDELSYDYKFENDEDAEKVKCTCGSSICPGYIG